VDSSSSAIYHGVSAFKRAHGRPWALVEAIWLRRVPKRSIGSVQYCTDGLRSILVDVQSWRPRVGYGSGSHGR
jgi:hypothetical protein